MMEEQYEFNKIMNAFESKGIQPSEPRKTNINQKTKQIKRRNFDARTNATIFIF